jgi:hypothetical protein
MTAFLPDRVQAVKAAEAIVASERTGRSADHQSHASLRAQAIREVCLGNSR